MTVVVNYWAVLVAAVSTMVVGSLWYGPFFGKEWMKMNGMSVDMMKDPAMKSKANRGYAVQFVASFVAAYVLKHFLTYAGAVTVSDAFSGAFWIVLGFIATTQLSGVLWMDKPVKGYLLDVGHYLVSYLVMAAILVSWM